MTIGIRFALLLAVGVSANCSDEDPTEVGHKGSTDAAVVMDTLGVASDASSFVSADARVLRPKPGSFLGDARSDAPPSAQCNSPCIAAILTATSKCPIVGTCTQAKAPPDAGAGLLQCYQDGAVVSLSGATGGRRVTVFKSTGGPCFALDEQSSWSILGAAGEALGRLVTQGADAFVACETVRVNDGDCSLPPMGNLLRPCADGLCALPKPSAPPL